MDYSMLKQHKDNYVPIGQGNLYPLSQKLEMLSQNNQSLYVLYMFQMNYFTGLYKVENDEELANAWPLIIWTLIENGKVGISMKEGKVIPFALNEWDYGVNGKIKSGTGLVASFNRGYNADISNHKLTLKNSVFGKYNNHGYPILFLMFGFLKSLSRQLQTAETNSLTKVKKFLFHINNNDSEAYQIEKASFTNNKDPFITRINDKSAFKSHGERGSWDSPNKIEPINTPTSSSDSDIWYDIDKHISFYYTHIGRRWNTNFKNSKARKNSKESGVETDNFDVLENTPNELIKTLIDDYNKAYNKTAKLVLMSTVNEESEVEENEEV